MRHENSRWMLTVNCYTEGGEEKRDVMLRPIPRGDRSRMHGGGGRAAAVFTQYDIEKGQITKLSIISKQLTEQVPHSSVMFHFQEGSQKLPKDAEDI